MISVRAACPAQTFMILGTAACLCCTAAGCKQDVATGGPRKEASAQAAPAVVQAPTRVPDKADASDSKAKSPQHTPPGPIKTVYTLNEPSEVRSLFGQVLKPLAAGPERDKQEAKLAEARAVFAQHPNDPHKLIWVGRRLGYLWRIPEALRTYTDGIKQFPDCAELYRHRGHRLITARRFREAEADLLFASELIADQPDRIEEDGMPNALNIPLTTTGFNVWYHLGLARYLQGHYHHAALAFTQARKLGRRKPDNVAAATDWTYMSMRRGGLPDAAERELTRISPDMKIIENTAYFQRLLMYKGLKTPQELLDSSDGALNNTTLAYGVGNWHYYNGRVEEAKAIFERILASEYWPAFGYIAAEADLKRMKKTE